jgi:release factor glutamine methyltransferase
MLKEKTMKIKELVDRSLKKLSNAEVEDFRNKFFILAEKKLNLSKEVILSHGDNEIDVDKYEMLEPYLDKIIEGIPVQYLVNEQEFYGLKFFVNENVLIPQPDTEIIVEEALNIISDGDRVLDLCTGSGVIGVTIANKKNVNVVASDISKKALEVAKINADNLGDSKVTLVESNLFENIEGKFNVIVSNPPYIKKDVIRTLSKEVQNEPIIALDGGIDGLDFYKKIVEEAINYLEDGGYLLLEIGYDQKEEVLNLVINKNYKDIRVRKDLSNNDRVVIMQKGE